MLQSATDYVINDLESVFHYPPDDLYNQTDTPTILWVNRPMLDTNTASYDDNGEMLEFVLVGTIYIIVFFANNFCLD